MQSPSLRFARTVQALGQAARALELVMPGFRTPPRLVGVHRSIKRRTDGATVAVVVKGRPWPAVQADMIEGIVAANQLTSPASDRVRAELWAAIAGDTVDAAPADSTPDQGDRRRPPGAERSTEAA